MNEATLANWRVAPHNVWAFRNVDQLIATAPIAAGAAAPLPSGSQLATQDLRLTFNDRAWTFAEVLAETECDGLLVLHDGRIAHESYRIGDAATRHIIFSVSKSFTALLAGILVADGKLDPDAPVTRYVPEVAKSAYGTASVRHVLDMTVGVRFEEDYLNADGAFARYRVATAWNPPNPQLGNAGLHAFLGTLPPDGEPHGRVYHYVSPNSDLLGWIVERAGGAPFAAQFAQRIWQPLGAEREAYVTIDNHGASRTAGGICTTLRDLARLGEMVRQGGAANGNQIVPRAWIDDIWQNGDAAAWQRGSMVHLLPQGRYRSQWYITGGAEPALCAIGIHGQWIYVQPHSKLVIVKQSSQRDPVNDAVDHLNLAFFAAIAREFRSR